jgi:predicted heme/steroid binding protein/uncharacterized membrane protein
MDRKIDRKTLAENNGKEGRPVYIAHGTRVVDVSESPLWAGGTHMGRHSAGKDLSAEIEAAPHGTEVLDRYPQAGVLVREEAASVPGLPKPLASFLSLYPFFRRHPHPATVHFPIVLTFCVTVFFLLYLFTGNRSFEQSAFYCLVGDIVLTPVAILTGLLTWWVNYGARRMRPVTIKQVLSFLALVDMVVLLVWRLASPGVVHSLSGWSFLYFLLICAMSPAMLAVSYYGGKLTFPIERD